MVTSTMHYRWGFVAMVTDLQPVFSVVTCDIQLGTHTHIHLPLHCTHTHQAYISPGWLFDLVIMPAARASYLKEAKQR